MTELQSKEGAELDKRGQRLKGQARSHAWSPGGVGGEQGDNLQGLRGRDSFRRGPDRVGLPTPPTNGIRAFMQSLPWAWEGLDLLVQNRRPQPAPGRN